MIREALRDLDPVHTKTIVKIALVLFCAIKMSREWVFVTIDGVKTTPAW